MKKLLLFVTLLVLILTVSCKKEQPASSSPYDFAVCTINMTLDKIAMVAGAESQTVPAGISAQMLIAKTPLPASLPADAKVTCNPEGIILCELLENGVRVTPQAVGTATFTVSPTTYPGESASCTVTVSDVPPVPHAVRIVKTDEHFHPDGQLYLLEGDSFSFSAVITSASGDAMLAEKVNWSVVEGTSYVSLDAESGLLTTQTLSGESSVSVKVRAEVVGYPDIKEEAMVKIQPLAKSVAISTSNFLNSDRELIAKKGSRKTFRYSIQPTGAYDDIEVIVKDAKVSVSRDGGDVVLTMSNTSSPSPVTVTLRSKKNDEASLSFDVYVLDYDQNDVKVGDYAYYAGGLFATSDCGLRYANGATTIYVNSNGCRTNVPKGIQSAWSSYYIGVIASTQSPELGCNVLKYCKNQDCEGNLYQYRNFSKDNLQGVSSKHCLVVRNTQSSTPVKWQNQGEYVAITTDTKNGIDQSQLSRMLAFSQNAKNNGYTYSDGNTGHGDFDYYNKCGFVAHLLLGFYSAHLNNVETFKVRPVLEIDAYTDGVPKFNGSGNTTGWFLPGEAEWAEIQSNFEIINASLGVNGIPFAKDQYFWSTEENGEKNVLSHKITASSISSVSYLKTDTAYTRAVLYF